MEEKLIKCFVVGDGCVGKTSMIERYTHGTDPHDIPFVPTVLGTYAMKLTVDQTPVKFIVLDASGESKIL